MHLRLKMMLASWSAFSCALALCNSATLAQTALPQVDVTVASPIRRAPARPSPQPAPAQPAPAQPAAASSTDTLVGTIPIITDQFATITVVPNDELRRNGASTLGDLLFEKPGITGSSFAPGASSRPIIRGLDVEPCAHPGERYRSQWRIRPWRRPFRASRSTDERQSRSGPGTRDTAVRLASHRWRRRSQPTTKSRPTSRTAASVPNSVVPALRSTAGSMAQCCSTREAETSPCMPMPSVARRRTIAYRVTRICHRPIRQTLPTRHNPAISTVISQILQRRATARPVGTSYIFNEGFFGLALTQNDALYHIPGIDGEDHDTRIDAHQTKLMSKGEWRSPSPVVDAVRFWGGVTDYKHNELGLADDTNPASDGIRQTFTNKEQEGRMEAQSFPSTCASPRSQQRSASKADIRNSQRQAPTTPACGIRTATGGSPATCSTNLNSAKRLRRRSPAGSNRFHFPGWAAVSTPPGR